MARTKFTIGRIREFQCESGKSQSFLWDTEAPGLGLRVTATGAKSYIFQAKLNNEALRMTIGSVDTWRIDEAQAEARQLKVIVDRGQDPRQVKAQQQATQEAARTAADAKALRESVTLGDIWADYVADRIASRENGWSDHHIAAHRKLIQAGGERRLRSPKLTEPGPLFSLSRVPLIALTTERIEAWARAEAKIRPSSARLAYRLLKACMNWCGTHKTYSSIVPDNPTRSTRIRESLGKPKRRNDVLQKAMLKPWFDAVRKIGNPVFAAYLQCLLLTGARREELAQLRWDDVSFAWGGRMILKDKIEGKREIPLTPYVASLLLQLPRRNQWVFSSLASALGHIAEPRIAHNEALASAGLPHLTLHGLRRSFATLSEWVGTPEGIAGEIQGHAPKGVREQSYIRRHLDLLSLWHVKIEEWILCEAGISCQSSKQNPNGADVAAA
ncbi:tyrosine-type recombinase/integrase [Massilia oculi]|uniref:Preprotein translocase n=1 Tax=Massilia oculi TaxID=945844 RepID=A0A2S2DIQ4_9BURK|nr:integrase arm-type DNA-binding domain-containing protein [Massilia oculi]AWL05225.1 preprotein translocase [Massilia oculi]